VRNGLFVALSGVLVLITSMLAPSPSPADDAASTTEQSAPTRSSLARTGPAPRCSLVAVRAWGDAPRLGKCALHSRQNERPKGRPAEIHRQGVHLSDPTVWIGTTRLVAADIAAGPEARAESHLLDVIRKVPGRFFKRLSEMNRASVLQAYSFSPYSKGDSMKLALIAPTATNLVPLGALSFSLISASGSK
jgi:hypothetical protein